MTKECEGPLVGLYWQSLIGLQHPRDLILLLDEGTTQARDWGDRNNQQAKDTLKQLLFLAQKGQCAYCRRMISNEVGHVEIDHILPKSSNGSTDKWRSNKEADRYCTEGYPQFTYETKNLVLTCKRCNNKKSSFDARANRLAAAPAPYSLTSDLYTLVHPHIDDYSDHIKLYMGLIYRPKNGSLKGDTTLRICKLDSVAAVEALTRSLRAKSSPDFIMAIMKLMGSVDEIGWEALTDAVIEAFPDIDRESIEGKVEEFRVAAEGRG